MQKLTVTILRNSAFGMAAQIIIKILSFGFSVLIIRNLGASEFGQYSAVIAFGITFSFLSDLGLSPYAVREIARLRDQPDGIEKAKKLYGNILSLRMILSGITIILVVMAAWLTDRPLLMIGAIALNSLGLLIYSIQGASDAVLAGFERLDISSGAKVLNQLSFVVIGGIALYLGLGYYGLIVATLIGVGVMAVVCWRGVHSLGIQVPRPNPKVWVQLLRASLPFGIIGFALGLSYKFDTVLLNIFRGDAETGFYSAAYNLVFSMVLFSNVLNTALYPSLSRQSVNDPERLNRSFERSLRYLMIFALPVAVGIWAIADQIIPFLFTQSFEPAIPALRIVIWVVPLMFASEFFGYIVLISGKEKKAARAVLVSTGFNVLINLILVPRFGIFAAAVMTVATEAVLVSQYLWAIRSVVSTFDLRQSFIYPLVSAILMGGAALLLHGLVPLWVNILVSAAVYFLLLLLFRVIGKDEMAILLKSSNAVRESSLFLKIVIAAPHYPPNYIGGTEQIAYRMAHALQKKGHDVSVVCVESIKSAKDQPFCQMEDEDGVQIRRLFFEPQADANFYQSSYRNDLVNEWMSEYLEDEKPDIVHLLSGYLISGAVLEAAYAKQSAVVVTLLDYWFVCPRITLLRANGDLCAEPVPPSRCAWCMLSHKRRYKLLDEKLGGLPGDAYTIFGKSPAVARVIGMNDEVQSVRDRRSYLKKMLEQADVVISHSNFLQEKIRENGIFTDNFVFLPNGIDFEGNPPPYVADNSRLLRIGYVGQIARHKGVHILIEAFQGLKTGAHPAELLIYGDDSRWPDYTAMLKQMAGQHAGIHFMGTYPADEVGRVLDGLDVLVVPSIWFENRPTVILEAFSRRKPVIASDMGGMAEMVRDNVDGFLFRPGDARSLAEQLQRMIDHPGELGRLAAGIQPVKAVGNEMDEIEQLYEKVLKQRQQMLLQARR